MRSDWPAGFTAASVSAALGALSEVGVSTKVTVPVRDDVLFDEAEVGSVFIDCTAEPRFHRSYPDPFEALSDASRIKQALVRWIDWPLRPGVINAPNGATLTNARYARIRLCDDEDQYWQIRHSHVDGGVPTIYVATESGLSKAAQVIGRELTMTPMRRRLRGLGEVGGELVLAMFGLLFLIGCCVSALAAVYGFGLLLGLW